MSDNVSENSESISTEETSFPTSTTKTTNFESDELTTSEIINVTQFTVNYEDETTEESEMLQQMSSSPVISFEKAEFSTVIPESFTTIRQTTFYPTEVTTEKISEAELGESKKKYDHKNCLSF